MTEPLDGTAALPEPPSTDAPALVVGLGASAGGIAALTEFFAQVPADAPFAYVVILHLSPDHESKLAEVLQRATALPVAQVRDTVTLRPRHVYVIPPNRSLRAVGDTLTLSDDVGPDERRAPINIFLRTLADTYQSRAVAVILSGTGSDGSMGLKRVKELGGLTVAQLPSEAQHADMPTRAIDTMLVDYVLPAEQIPTRILDYYRHLSSEPIRRAADPTDTSDDDAIREVLRLLRARTSHDFSDYKPATIRRRIARRMSLHGFIRPAEYARFIKDDPIEATALMKDLLISVTNFFRDAPAFAALEQEVIPRLFQGRDATAHVRVWSAGCATGEEAYSVAMLLAEHATALIAAPRIQVFATDLDDTSIRLARDGLYAEADVADVSPNRLQRFFQRESGGFRVRRELRELVLFAEHNVIKDPPFSHLDLILCRNLLIYLNRASQQRVMETFQFALRRDGYLFLGNSESADERQELFDVVDAAAHIYQVRPDAVRPHLTVYETSRSTPVPTPIPESPPAGHIAPAELHLRLLEQFGPPSMVVTDDHLVVHISDRAAEYLRTPAGEPTRDVLKLVRPELRADLRSALLVASQQRGAVDVHGARLRRDDGESLVTIHVKPVFREGERARGYYVVLFDEERNVTPEPAIVLPTRIEGESDLLNEELARVNEQLRTTVERSAVQVEEAKAANEELQAMNEELRSSAEELETSKEELQSSNEELATVNQELKIKIDELAAANNDFLNLMASTEMAAVFLDRTMRVKLSTPRAQEVFNLRPADAGRRLSDITNRLLYEGLYADIETVLRDLQMIERQVETREGGAYVVRIHPYRTADDRIEGVALTFQDVTEHTRVKAQMRLGEERLQQQQQVLSQIDARVDERTAQLQAEVSRQSSAQQHVTRLLSRLVTAQEDERARIARDLHDQLGQHLTALRLALERHREARHSGGRADDDLERAVTLAQQVDSQVDFLAWELRPAALDDLGLTAALPRFLAEWSAYHGLQANFQATGSLPARLSPAAETTFYRVTQEALTNVVKHAHATRVDVVLEGGRDSVSLVIEDDGVGFEPAAADKSATGIGLIGMRERATLIDATLQIESSPGKGTTIYLRLPVPFTVGDAST